MLLDIVPRDDEPLRECDVLAKPVFRRIFVVCERNSTVMFSSGDAERASGQMNDCAKNGRNKKKKRQTI